MKFKEYKNLDLSQINKEILEVWDKNKTFEKSLSTRKGKPTFVFYEGPPSANGIPGIHHVMARTIKDIFCRYKTLQGYYVERKAGWDTHGLPVELSVEKTLGITKEDIGKKISVEEYNNTCKKEVMKYTDLWEELTRKMGYWVDMKNPYITYDNRYIETLWYLLKKLYEKGLLYKGYSIQPYSPAAGSGLSTHELNQPGCYRDVKDTTATAQFKIIKDNTSGFLFENVSSDIFILAWTTTPWTLPSNSALAVGEKIKYLKIQTVNQYTGKQITVILAKDLLHSYFNKDNETEFLPDNYKAGDKKLPYKILNEYTGKQLLGINYEQLIPWVKPTEKAFKVIAGDYVTTEDGTGIVHIAPTFGADDNRVAKQAGIPPIIVIDKDKIRQALVDKKGRFYPIDELDNDFVSQYVNVEKYSDFAGRYVKNAYDDSLTEKDITTDILISVMLKKENKAFKIEKHEHNYPHCWRTDKPVLYYPLDSWFIKVTAVKDKMIELNNTINWKPKSTGSGRFGKWLENIQDWNLSRSRYWGTPLPVWATEDRSEIKCIGSIEELKNEIEKAVEHGIMKENPFADFVAGDFSTENYEKINLHRPLVDEIFLVSDKGMKMTREPDLIDVWFDSGAMPYAQYHFPFENPKLSLSENNFEEVFPADFIAEGVDQTRGWFYTLHAIATMISDSVAFKNIISNGLVLDKLGNKMSKRLGNAVDPFKTIDKFGSDPLRWYMITNAQPWDNLKFDIEGVDEVKRKFFGTLYNTYSFFALYANVDNFEYKEDEIPVENRPEIDRWIISLLNSLIKDVETYYNNYEPTKAARAIQEFVTENLSNWYVRLNRKRYWGGEYNENKLAAYQTLYKCIETVAILASPVMPFYSEKLFTDLNSVTRKKNEESVHLTDFPKYNEDYIDKSLEEKMSIAQKISSMILGLRRKVALKVRQPLNKIILPVLDDKFQEKVEQVKEIILSEVNIKDIEYISDTSGILVKKIKPNFKTLGPKYGKLMKEISAKINSFSQEDIRKIETEKQHCFSVNDTDISIDISDVEIISEDIPGLLVANDGKYTVALDINITTELKEEGIARELINRIQNFRKDSGFDVVDKILIEIQKHNEINNVIYNFKDYICSQTLAKDIILSEKLEQNNVKHVELDNNVKTLIKISKI